MIKRDCNIWVSLDLIRQRPMNISDFMPYQSSPTLIQSVYRPSPYSKIKRTDIDQRLLHRREVFISKILADFAHQWRHILSGQYNNSTLQKLAYAIVRISTLDFTVKEATESRQGAGGFLVWIDNLPEWDKVSGHIVRAGETSIVICQHALHAVSLARQDFVKQVQSGSVDEQSLTYLILSVREISLYQINSMREKYTEPKRLFDGTHPPSDEAIELLLLQATQISTPPSLHRLPIELQDAILDRVSAGPIERARVGCLLNSGSAFTWKCGNRDVVREEGRRSRTPWTPVESHIWFGDYHSGLAYK